MIPVVLVVPSRYEPERLRRVLRTLGRDADRVFVIDTGHEPPFSPEHARVQVVRMDPEPGIYRWWNEGWRLAREYAQGPVDIAIVNDDAIVHPGTLRLLARMLRSQPDIGAVYPDARCKPARDPLPAMPRLTVDRDPAGARELTGYCFMFRGELPLPPFDEGYGWWYGDSQFDESVRLAGYGVARVDGVPIAHHSDAEHDDWARRPDLKAIVERDGIRWAELHREIRDGRWYPIAEVVAP